MLKITVLLFASCLACVNCFPFKFPASFEDLGSQKNSKDFEESENSMDYEEYEYPDATTVQLPYMSTAFDDETTTNEMFSETTISDSITTNSQLITEESTTGTEVELTTAITTGESFTTEHDSETTTDSDYLYHSGTTVETENVNLSIS